MKKKIIYRIVAFFLVIGGCIYFYNEYKTKNLLQDVLHIEQYKNKDRITIMEDTKYEKIKSEDFIVSIDENNANFKSLLNVLEGLNIKRNVKVEPSGTEYMFIVRHNYLPNYISIYENGVLLYEDKVYRIQGQDSLKRLLKIIKECFTDIDN